MKQFYQILSYILVAVAAVCVTLTVTALSQSPEYHKLDQLEKLIEDRFVGEIDSGAMEDGAAAGMVEALGDRWSHYMTKEEYTAYMDRMTNSYVGVGITVQVNKEGYVDVLRVEPGGPAEEAGVQGGDVLIAVDGQDVKDRDINETKALVQGESGSTVSLTFRRGQETLTLQVQRRLVQTQVAKWQMLEGNVGLVTIVNFDSRCADESIAAIEALVSQGAKALIFDVRNNPGGYKDELVELLDYLLPEGPLFRSVLYDGTEELDESGESCLDIPMAVLANENSYSAAEFFAAALVEYEKAQFVGEPTTGKGRFQTTFRLADGSAVTLSIGTYTTPKGVDLTDVGLTPDILVDVDEETALRIYYGDLPPEEDPQIQAALKLLTADN